MEIMLYKEELRKCLLIKGGTILMYINTLYSDWMYCHSSKKKKVIMSSCVVPIKIFCGQVDLI